MAQAETISTAIRELMSRTDAVDVIRNAAEDMRQHENWRAS
jgi:hypothetical protein